MPAALRRGAYWLLWLGCALATAQVAATEVFKWRDADGHVHFGDRPAPAGAESLTVHARPPSVANDNGGGNHQERLREVLESYTKEREAREATQAADQQAADTHHRICTAAKKNQYALEHANFLFDYTDSGERRVLEGAEYDRAIARSRKAVVDSCE